MDRRSRNPFRDAFSGILATYRSERNLRIHFAIALIVIALAFWLDISRGEWCWIILCIALVVMAELMNTAIEAWVDLVSPNEHPLAGKAKDAAAGAVLVGAVFAAIVGSVILLPRLWLIFMG